jgi:hypothetical protein
MVVSSIGETGKSQGAKSGKVGVEDDSHTVFGKKFPGGKGSVCTVALQQPVLL